MIRKLVAILESIFKLSCPYCHGIMDGDMYDPLIDHIIYTCRKCHKQFILI